MSDQTITLGSAHGGDSGETRSWRWPALLAAPLLICFAVLCVTGRTLPTFWGGDEVAHWALIKWFAASLPRFAPNYPASATTPLFHLAGACLVLVFGAHLQLIRACNVLLSVGGVLLLYRTLRRTGGHTAPTAALLAAVFLFSSYYFGYAFLALTDNMAIVGCLLAMGELFRFVDPAEPRPLAHFLWGCLWCCVAILTRQSYVFLGLPFGLALLISRCAWTEKFIGLAGLGLALAPFAALVVAWHGLVPPGMQLHHTPSPLNFYPLALPVMLLGLYTPFFLLPPGWRRWRASTLPPRWWVGPVIGAGLAVVVLVRFPLFPVRSHRDLTPYFPALGVEDWGKYFGGWIYSVADRSGRLTFCHNSFLFWLALPLGAAAVMEFVPQMWRANVTPLQRTTAFFLVGVLLTSMLNSVCAQKYYDGLVLLFLIWRSSGETARDATRRWLLASLIGLFCLYAAVFPLLSNTIGLKPLPVPVMTPAP